MSDDWPKEFDLDKNTNKPEMPSDNSEKAIALDSLGIPILEEVVILEDDYAFNQEISLEAMSEPSVEIHEKPEASFESSITNQSRLSNDLTLEQLTDKLKKQLRHEIEDIAASIANTLVSNISSELERQIKTELSHALDRNLDEMINSAITNISGGNNFD